MNSKQPAVKALTLVLVIIAVSACVPAKADVPCPTSQPLTCPTSQPQACPTAPACPSAPAAQIFQGEKDTGCIPSNPTLTFNTAGDQCTYTGPNTVPYGKFTVDVVPGQYSEGYGIGYVIITLKEGKTIDDLSAYTSPDPPSWMKNLLYDSGSIQQNTSVPHDVRSMSNYTYGDPLYIVCFYGDASQQSKIGAIGPIEVKK